MSRSRVAGVGALLAVLAAVAVLLVEQAVDGWAAVLGPGPVRTDAVVVAVAATTGAAVAAWLALGALVSTVLLLRGSHRRPALLPLALHRAVALALGVALAAGTAPASTPDPPVTGGPAPSATTTATATADAGVGSDLDPGWTASATRTGGNPTSQPPTSLPPMSAASPSAAASMAQTTSTAVDPGWRPSVPPPAPAAVVAVPGDPLLLGGGRAVPDEQVLVTVRRGDTLWDVAARHLGPQATDAEIAVAWPRWYEANRDVVGPDPDLLLPGQQLQPPGRSTP